MKTLVLLLLLNNPDGSQEIVSRSLPMVAAECDALQRAVWAMPETVNPVQFMDEDGPAQRFDAACVDPSAN